MPSRVEQFRALVAQQPDNELFRFTLAQSLLADGCLTEAVPHLEYCVAKKSDWMMPRILLGKLLVQLSQIQAAKPHLEDALRLAIAQNHEEPMLELKAMLAELP